MSSLNHMPEVWPPFLLSDINKKYLSMPEAKENKGWRNWCREHPIVLVLLIIIIVRFLINTYIVSLEWSKFLIGLDDAVIIACIVGGLIEFWFAGRLAKDVFEASIGHLLPDQLKTAARWVYGFNLLCERHIQNVTVDNVSGLEGYVVITATIERTIRNISSKKQTFTPQVSMEEWNVPGHPSEIIECGYQYGETTETKNTLETTNDYAIYKRVRFDAIELNPDDTIKVWYQTKEYKRTTDMLIWTFTWPTTEPTLTITLPDELDIHVGYVTHKDDWEKDRYSHTYRLHSTLLPTQYIEIKWWPKNAKANA